MSRFRKTPGAMGKGRVALLELLMLTGVVYLGLRVISWTQRTREKVEELHRAVLGRSGSPSQPVGGAQRAGGRTSPESAVPEAGTGGGGVADGSPPGSGARAAPDGTAPGDGHAIPWHAPVLDVSWMGTAELAQLQAIDPNVVAGADFWLKADLSDLGALKAVVAQAAESPNYDHWFNALKGYVGEQVAADVLEHSGAHVELASLPNQPGYDLLVDGVPLNVKVGESPQLIREHFDRYPDVAVITGPDLAARVPEHADQVVVLPELSNASVEHVTQSTLDQVVHLGWDANLPVVTMVLSSLRELTLLVKGHTDVITGLKHVALDAGGTGAGILAGGKLGAGLGTAVAPGVGTAVGGILGALIGGLAGRGLTNRMKSAPLRRAVERYEQAAEEARRQWDDRRKGLRERALTQISRAEQDLKEELARIEGRHRGMVARGKEVYEAQILAFLKALPDLLRNAEASLAEHEERVLASMPRSTWIRRWLWPTERDVEWRAAQVWFDRQRGLLRRKAEEAASIVPGPALTAEGACARARALLDDPSLVHPELVGALEELRQNYQAVLELIALEQRLAAAEAREAIARKARQLQQSLVHDLEQVSQWGRDQKARLSSLLEDVRREARKLGREPG